MRACGNMAFWFGGLDHEGGDFAFFGVIEVNVVFKLFRVACLDLNLSVQVGLKVEGLEGDSLANPAVQASRELFFVPPRG